LPRAAWRHLSLAALTLRIGGRRRSNRMLAAEQQRVVAEYQPW